jgi:hypothetical protein
MNIATPHDAEMQPYDKAAPNAADMARYASAGGLLITATDYSKFLINLFDKKYVDMFLPQSRLPAGGEIDGCQQWGLGWGLKDVSAGRLIVHSGGQQGIRSLAVASVENKNGFIALTNGDNGAYVVYRVLAELEGMLVTA